MANPNLFNFATSELSQDAIIAWLLQWGSIENSGNQMQNIGSDFARFLISKQSQYSKEIQNIKANRQWMNIDVWAKINDEILILIEDKTNTAEHSDQLTRYKTITEDWCTKNNFQPIYIYLKTFSQSRSDIKLVESKGYSLVERSDLIDFLSAYKIENHILYDYFCCLVSNQEREDSYKKLKIKEWSEDLSWIGFYKYLESQLNILDWQYVPNQNGGFMGIWWHFHQWRAFDVYLQIEQGNLCFKIGNVSEDHSQVRNEWFEIVNSNAKSKGISEIVKPSRFGSGAYMTVAMVEPKNWLGSDESVIDSQAVVQNLKKYEQFLIDCLK